MNPNQVTLRVWGDFACFTRPEMKVERVSYPVMTPSAARGILEAVFWEPQMYYIIDSIRVVKRGQWVSFRRNEVIKIISLDSAKTWMNAPEKVTPIHAGGGADDGTQRNMLALENVEYLITAEVRATYLDRRSEDQLIKYCHEIERRARGGKCFHRPALGVREFAADFEWECSADVAQDRRCNELGGGLSRLNEDLGLMLYDVFDWQERQDGFRWLSEDERLKLAKQSPNNPNRRGRAADTKLKQLYAGLLVKPRAVFFHARMFDSKIDCHPERIRLLTATDGGKKS